MKPSIKKPPLIKTVGGSIATKVEASITHRKLKTRRKRQTDGRTEGVTHKQTDKQGADIRQIGKVMEWRTNKWMDRRTYEQKD
jgi:hypothetical protein